MNTIEFSLTNTTPLTFKVSGMTDDKGTLPTYLAKDMIVTLVSGKWPLDDYKDCDRHTFVFEKADGSKFSLLLSGFTWDCSLPKEKQQAIIDRGDTYIGIDLLEQLNITDDEE